jgi:hypothetical protein
MSKSTTSLYELKEFKLAFYLPISVALILILIVICTNNFGWQFDLEGINNVWEIFKIPLSVCSLIIPLVALVAANHRSIQSKKQIETTLEQNRISLRPLLSVDYKRSKDDEELSILLKNKGLGIAKITAFKWEEDDGTASNGYSFGRSVVKLTNERVELEYAEEIRSVTHLAKDEDIVLLSYRKLHNPDYGKSTDWDFLSHFLHAHGRILITYESLYEESFDYEIDFYF